MKTESPNDLSPKYNVNFNLRGSLSRAMNSPLVVSVPRLVIFGDSSAIYLAQLTDQNASPYQPLSCIKAQIYIHGWAVQPRDWSTVEADDTVKLYVVDGFELSLWDLVTGKKLQERTLIGGADVAIARQALDNLQMATQRVEWATLLEQAEDEWVKLTAERSAAEPGSDERERLDLLSADYLRVLRALREMTGNTGGSAASQTLVANLKTKLAEARKTAAPYLFSTPLVRPAKNPDKVHKIDVMQGNGTLHRTDSWLNDITAKKLKDSAEPQVVLLNDRFAFKEWLGYISNSTLYVHDPTTLEEKSHWSPTPAPAAGTRHTLSAGNDQFWWSTDTGAYVLKPNASGVLQLSWKTGAPWALRQVGRYSLPQTPYTSPVNPNDLFDTMNIKAWIAKRSDPSAPLTDGALAQLLLSDEAGKYTSPPEGKSYLIALPEAGASNTRWTNITPHPTMPLLLLSDSRGVSTQCRYPSSVAGQQLLPHWTTAPWLNSLSSIREGSPIDLALAKPFDAPKVRPLSKPYTDMIAQLWEGNPDTRAIGDLVGIVPDGKLLDRHLRYVIWFALLGWDSNFVEIPWRDGAHGSRKPSQFPSWLARRFGMGSIWPRFGLYGNVFRVPDEGAAKQSFRSTSVAVNFDPPWTWPAGPPMDLFHSPPPAWYDPWGYNRPGDFVSDQPSPTYLDPFCFDGQLKFPQRPVTFDGSFKGRTWAVFVEKDPAEPNTLVVLTDEERQRTTLQLVPPKTLRLTFDANNHTFQQEVTTLGSISKLVVAPPAVAFNPGRTLQTAWCVMSSASVSTRLRRLVTYDSKTSAVPWDKFVDANKARYGPGGTGKTWKIEVCPLPDVALPEVVLDGYVLPAS